MAKLFIPYSHENCYKPSKFNFIGINIKFSDIIFSSKLVNLFIYLGLIFLVSGCSIDRKKLSNNIAMIEEEKGIPIHGNFCGSKIPTISSGDTNEVLSQLNSIDPIDKIDALCKAHDTCYVNFPKNQYDCDKSLIYHLDKLDLSFQKTECFGLVEAIKSAFFIKNLGLSFDSELESDLAISTVNTIGTGSITGIQKIYQLTASIILVPFGLLTTNNSVSEIYDDIGASLVEAQKEVLRKPVINSYHLRNEVCNL